MIDKSSFYYFFNYSYNKDKYVWDKIYIMGQNLYFNGTIYFFFSLSTIIDKFILSIN